MLVAYYSFDSLMERYANLQQLLLKATQTIPLSIG